MTTEKQKPIGGFYSRTSKKGLDYLNGYILIEGVKHNIVAFKNKTKFDETTPDYAIFISQPMGEKPVAVASDTEIPF